MLIFRSANCIITASGIATLRKRPYSMPVESGLTVMKPRNMRTAGHSGSLHTDLLWGSLNEGDHLENLVVNVKTIKNIRFYMMWHIIGLSICNVSHSITSQQRIGSGQGIM